MYFSVHIKNSHAINSKKIGNKNTNSEREKTVIDKFGANSFLRYLWDTISSLSSELQSGKIVFKNLT